MIEFGNILIPVDWIKKAELKRFTLNFVLKSLDSEGGYTGNLPFNYLEVITKNNHVMKYFSNSSAKRMLESSLATLSQDDYKNSSIQEMCDFIYIERPIEIIAKEIEMKSGHN